MHVTAHVLTCSAALGQAHGGSHSAHKLKQHLCAHAVVKLCWMLLLPESMLCDMSGMGQQCSTGSTRHCNALHAYEQTDLQKHACICSIAMILVTLLLMQCRWTLWVCIVVWLTPILHGRAEPGLLLHVCSGPNNCMWKHNCSTPTCYLPLHIQHKQLHRSTCHATFRLVT